MFSVDNIAGESILSLMNRCELKAGLTAIGFWLAACALMLSTIGGCSGQTGALRDSAPPAKAPENGAVAATKPPANATKTVELVIDYGDGVQKRFTDIGWKESMTVLDVLKAAEKNSHGISFPAHGSGETAMVTKIDDVANQGSGDRCEKLDFPDQRPAGR